MRLEFESNSSALPVTEITSENEPVEKGSGAAKELLREGIKAAQAGNRSEARHLLLRVTELESANENAWLWLASISEYPEELLVFLKNVLEINPDNQRAIEWTKATKSLLAKTFVQRGIDAAREDQKGFANQCFNHAIAQDENNETAWIWMASVSDSDEEKIGFLEKALSIDPENPDALAGLASLSENRLEAAYTAAAQGDNARANELLDLVLERIPESEDAWLLKSDLVEDKAAKISILEKVLMINPENEEAAAALESVGREIVRGKFQSAGEAAASGDHFLANSLLEEVLAKSPEMEEAWVLKSHLSENFDDKIKAFEKVLEINPGNAAAQAGLESLTAIMSSIPPQTVEESPEPAPVTNRLKEEVAEDRSPTQDLVFPEALAEENPFENNQPVEMESEAEFSEESASEEEQASLTADPWPTAESLPEVSESVEELYGQSVPDRSDYENEDDFQASAESAAFDEQPSLEVEPSYKEGEAEEAASIHDTEMGFGPGESPFADCPYCRAKNDAQAYQCDSCCAILTLSNLEMLLAQQNADKQILGFAVDRMEAERERRAFSEDELKALGIAYINLKNFPWGLDCLQEAQRMNPNDVLLSGQVNALSIRFAEIREQEEAHDAMPRGKTILVVDDSATVRKLIAGKLEKSGHEVICAVDGVDALEKIEEVVPDLILLDINMPRMDGYQVCKLIRNNHATANVPVVMISGKDGFFDKVRGRMSGTTGYITKPFGPETLMKALETYIVNDVEPVTAEQ